MLTMKKSRIISDQYDNWSDIFAETIAPISPEPTQISPAPTSSPLCAPTWLAHRTLQTMRQTRMQMRPGTRPRPQVLPLHQPTRSDTGYGLCPAGGSRHGRSVHRELSLGPRNPRSSLLHQSRTASSQGASIEKERAPRKVISFACTPDRSPPGGHPHRQHARAVAPSRSFIKLSRRNQR
jgi:hypothetical protein